MRRNGEPGGRSRRARPDRRAGGRDDRRDRLASSPGGAAGAAGADVAARGAGRTAGVAGGEIAGYRLVRRMATGDRAVVYLATPATSGPGSGAAPGSASASTVDGLGGRPASPFAPPPDRQAADAPPETVALRLYAPEADPDAITVELEALAVDGGRILPAPHDLASFADGRVCLVVERIAGERLSKLLGERSLTPGEAVTVLAPIAAVVRRLADAGFVHTRLAASDVLFDATGRPRLLGLGALVRLHGLSAVERSSALREGHSALGRLVAEVAAAVRPPSAFARALAVVTAGLATRPFKPFALELEQVLFEIAEPAPVRGSDASAGPADVRPRIAPPPIAGVGSPAIREAAAEHPLAAPLLDAETTSDAPRAMLAHESPLLVALNWSRLRAAARAAVGRRRAPVLVGALGGGAALVVMLALVPPSEPGGPAFAANDGGIGAAAGGAAHADPTPADAEPGSNADAVDAREDAEADDAVEADPAAVAAELLELRTSCLTAADRKCLAAVVQPGSALEADDLALLALEPGQRPDPVRYDLSGITVQGAMGQAVLLQVPMQDAERQPASLLMVRSEAGWRLRELFG